MQMASSKYSLAERLVKQIQSRMSKEAKIGLREAILAIGSARDSVVRNKVLSDYYEGGVRTSNYLSEFGYDEKLTPTWDGDRGLYSLSLPALPIQLPKNIAIQDVSIKGQTEYAFVQVAPFSGNLYRNLAASNIPRPAFFQKGGSIYFSPDTVGEKSEIIISMIAQSSGIADRDTLPIDPDMELEIITLAKEILLAPNNPEDTLNDGVGT